MLADRALFHVGAEPWMLSRVCLLVGLMVLALAASLLALLLVRRGRLRRLEGWEASRVAFNADKLGEVRPVHGPAGGVEVRVTFTIGDLRRAYQAGDRLVFWGMPAMLVSWSAGFCLLSLWGALVTGEAVLLAGLVVLVPMFLIGCFMPWAAVYTKLE